MREIETKVKVYKFEELSSVTKKKLIDKESIELSEIWTPGFEIEEFEEKLNGIGFDNVKCWYSLGGGQGDGACFDADVDLEKICKHLNIDYDSDKNDWFCRINIISNHYSHERTRAIEFYDYNGELNELDEDVIRQSIENLRIDLCKELHNILEESYRAYISEESCIDGLNEREYVFLDEIGLNVHYLR
jgi:dissimilatory sulfite reductase (desulfoviridin) alpha/beta subunit